MREVACEPFELQGKSVDYKDKVFKNEVNEAQKQKYRQTENMNKNEGNGNLSLNWSEFTELEESTF